MDLSNSMECYLNNVKVLIPDIIKQLKKEFPGVEIYIGFIGYKNKTDLNNGENFINFELTKNHENILKVLKELKVDGDYAKPKDLCGVLEFAIKKGWKGKSKFAILFTDSLCYGKKYYDDKIKNYDEYPERNGLDRNIEDYIKFFAENEISLFWLRINESTDKMFNIFEEIYNKNKKNDSNNQFLTGKVENIFNFVISTAITTFRIENYEF